MKQSNRRGSSLTGALMVVAAVGLYFAAQLWILPAMGIAT